MIFIVNDKYHEEGKYFRGCEVEYAAVLEDIKSYKKEGLEIIGVKYPNCQLDGRYGPVQENDK